MTTDLRYPKSGFNVEDFTPIDYEGRPFHPVPPLYPCIAKRLIGACDTPDMVVRLLDTTGETPTIDPTFTLSIYSSGSNHEIAVSEVKRTGVPNPYTEGDDVAVDYYQVLYHELVPRAEEYMNYQFSEGKYLFISEVNNCQFRNWLEAAGVIATSRARFAALDPAHVEAMNPVFLPPEELPVTAAPESRTKRAN